MTMRLNIKNAETDRLARELAAATGESITTAVTTALRERLERIDREVAGESSAGSGVKTTVLHHQARDREQGRR